MGYIPAIFSLIATTLLALNLGSKLGILGCIVGLLGSVFWIIYALAAHIYPLLISSAPGFIVYPLGIYRHLK